MPRDSKIEQPFLSAIFNINVAEFLQKVNCYRNLRGDIELSSQNIVICIWLTSDVKRSDIFLCVYHAKLR